MPEEWKNQSKKQVPFMYELAFDPDWDGIKLKVCN
jgi:hypothetical protein